MFSWLETHPERELDDRAVRYLDQFLDLATVAEQQLLPRRMLRALNQMSEVLRSWAAHERRIGNERRLRSGLLLKRLHPKPAPAVDPYLVAERWLGLVAPVFETHRMEARRRSLPSCEISNRGS